MRPRLPSFSPPSAPHIHRTTHRQPRSPRHGFPSCRDSVINSIWGWNCPKCFVSRQSLMFQGQRRDHHSSRTRRSGGSKSIGPSGADLQRQGKRAVSTWTTWLRVECHTPPSLPRPDWPISLRLAVWPPSTRAIRFTRLWRVWEMGSRPTRQPPPLPPRPKSIPWLWLRPCVPCGEIAACLSLGLSPSALPRRECLSNRALGRAPEPSTSPPDLTPRPCGCMSTLILPLGNGGSLPP